MKKIIALALAAAALSSCMSSPVGALFADNYVPQMISSAGGSKVGTSSSTTYLGLVSQGDGSIAAAKRAGGISTPSSVDVKVNNILGIITTYTTTVTGH
ncbi:MAG: TRL domain-containing protein [Akkermansia sp.]|nr:TRL domain-containing protein [Akkermansia sp.]